MKVLHLGIGHPAHRFQSLLAVDSPRGALQQLQRELFEASSRIQKLLDSQVSIVRGLGDRILVDEEAAPEGLEGLLGETQVHTPDLMEIEKVIASGEFEKGGQDMVDRPLTPSRLAQAFAEVEKQDDHRVEAILMHPTVFVDLRKMGRDVILEPTTHGPVLAHLWGAAVIVRASFEESRVRFLGRKTDAPWVSFDLFCY